MKSLSKFVSVIIALLILAFSFVSVFGVSYYEGDNKITVIKGFRDIDWGIDVSGGTKVALDVASPDEIQNVAKIIEKRATRFGLKDYQLALDNEAGSISLVVPSDVDCEFSAEEVATLLSSYGYFAMRPGNSYEDMIVDSSNGACFVKPVDETAKTVLIDGSLLESSGWFEYSESDFTYYYVTATFGEVGSQLLNAFTNADTGAYYNQTVSVWLDDRMLAFPTISEPLTDGSISFTSDNMTESKAMLYSAIIGTGTLPSKVTVSSVSQVEPVVSEGTTHLFMYAGIIAAIIIAVIMIIKYRFTGVVSVFAALAQFSAVLAVITRFAGNGNTFMMTIAGLVGFALSVLLAVLCCVIFGEKINSELSSGTDVETAVTKSIEKSRKAIVDINFILIIVALIGMFMFGTSTLITGIFGSAVMGGAYTFSYVLFFGALLNFVTGYFLPQLMLRSLVSFKAFKKPSVFGGAK